ncbi:MAG: DUF5606 domain-containing protein [Chitinophagaceae bacterium]
MMDYSKLVAVTGMPGLYELITSKNDGAIVRSLDDNSTKFASSRIHNFSHLESIEVYTVNDNVNLVEVFHAMEKTGGDLPDGKDNALLKKYFESVYPDLDFERVYSSDLKKMVKWFEVLRKNKVEIKLSELPEEEEMVEEIVEVAETPAPAKKAAKKKEAEAPAAEEEKAPKKKAAPKKEAKAKDEEPKAPAKKAAPKKK